jgi:hypothetical protein
VSQLVYNVADYYPPDMIAGTHAVFRYKNYVFLGDEVFPAVFKPREPGPDPTRWAGCTWWM